MSDDDITFVGEHIGYGGQAAVPFGIRRDDRRHHLYAIGKTGTGKTTLLERLITQDIEAGEGVVFLDPHGDSALRLLEHVLPSRTDHVCYFDPADLGLIGLINSCPTLFKTGDVASARMRLSSASVANSSSVPEATRVDCYLYADEFQRFATESFASILSEARKYRLALSLFHQCATSSARRKAVSTRALSWIAAGS